MSAEQFERFYVLEQFREFYALVLRFKQELEASAPLGATPGEDGESLDDLLGAGAGGEDGTPLDPAQLQAQRAEYVRGELIALMQRQAQDVLRRGDEREQRRFREVQYVMAAMADEVLLSLNWSGKDYFGNNLIEEEIFRTHDAGSRFFANLEELLRLRDPTRAEVAAAYLLALSLGFRGKYREVENQPRLENYRQQLFATLFQRNPGLSDDQPLYAQAYAHTLAGKQLQWLPLLRPWLIGMGGVALGYVLIAHIVWAHASGNVAGIVDRLGTKERPKGSPAAPAPAPAPQARAADPPSRRPLTPLPQAAPAPAPAPSPASAEPADAPEPGPATLSHAAPAGADPAGREPGHRRRKHHRSTRHHSR
jgi:type VI secretion system protein ImpK